MMDIHMSARTNDCMHSSSVQHTPHSNNDSAHENSFPLFACHSTALSTSHPHA